MLWKLYIYFHKDFYLRKYTIYAFIPNLDVFSVIKKDILKEKSIRYENTKLYLLEKN